MKKSCSPKNVITSGRPAFRKDSVKRGSDGAPSIVLRFSESFLFTVGLAVLISYFTFILIAAPKDSGMTDCKEAVGVFAQSHEFETEEETGGGIWEKLGECLEDAFGKGEK